MDGLEAERDQWREASGNAHDMWEEADAERNELRREVDRLTRENISLACDLGECMAERDELIAEIDALEYRGELDEPRGTKVDINGEVVG